MAPVFYKSTAPASLMLMGEHAVLHGYPAIVCAVNKYLTATLTPREDKSCFIHSNLGEYKAPLHTLSPCSPFELIINAILHYKMDIKTGFELRFCANFPPMGLGSSGAALTVTLSLLQQWLFKKRDQPKNFLQVALKIIHQNNGVGSGADVAASLLGGVVFYQMSPLFFESLEHFPSITAIYSGTKVPTQVAIQKVKLRSPHPDLIYKAIAKGSYLAYDAIRSADWPKLGRLFNEQQKLMDKLGVNTPRLQSLIDKLNEQPHILGAKISGAGLGDCVIGLGNTDRLDHLNLTIVNEGLVNE